MCLQRFVDWSAITIQLAYANHDNLPFFMTNLSQGIAHVSWVHYHGLASTFIFMKERLQDIHSFLNCTSVIAFLIKVLFSISVVDSSIKFVWDKGTLYNKNQMDSCVSSDCFWIGPLSYYMVVPTFASCIVILKVLTFIYSFLPTLVQYMLNVATLVSILHSIIRQCHSWIVVNVVLIIAVFDPCSYMLAQKRKLMKFANFRINLRILRFFNVFPS